MNMPNFALCNTPFSVIAAVSLLNASPAIIVDCEALQLGTRGGILSLISIRSISPKPSYCYLFDALALSSSYLQPLFNLLTNPNILKVFYDGRRDWCAFYYTYKVRIRNVLDLQLVDLTSRFMRGEGTAQQRQRLLRLFTLEQIKQNEAKFAHVHVLNGLAASLKEHVFLYKRPLGLNKQRVDHDDWLIRPLPIDYLHYAAQDVEIIHVLYAYFIQAGYITRNPFLFSQSEHYISLWSDAIPEPDDVYRANPLLPLEILQIPELSVTSSSPSFLCQGCSRALSPLSFHIEPRLPSTRLLCCVCSVVQLWQERWRPWEMVKPKRVHEEVWRQEVQIKAWQRESARQEAGNKVQPKAGMKAQKTSRREEKRQAKQEAEKKAQQENARREAEDRARKAAADAKVRRETRDKARREAEENARRKAVNKARQVAEVKAQSEAKARVKANREARAERKARRKAERKQGQQGQNTEKLEGSVTTVGVGDDPPNERCISAPPLSPMIVIVSSPSPHQWSRLSICDGAVSDRCHSSPPTTLSAVVNDHHLDF
ncbi:ribonuclease H-like domain-containing protein [Lentinula raphanica]|nr:ribonuclease H-like domain-containing protein [Lentinula raphanica]